MSTILLVFPELSLFGDYELFESYCERSENIYQHQSIFHSSCSPVLVTYFATSLPTSPSSLNKIFGYSIIIRIMHALLNYISLHHITSHHITRYYSLADALCGSTMGMESEIQLVFFHPRYQFRDGQVRYSTILFGGICVCMWCVCVCVVCVMVCFIR